jgi:hypothetical protein
MDLAKIGKALDIPLPAILGQEVFHAFVVDIDFEHSRIAFRDPRTFVPPHGATRLPLIPVHGDLATRITVEGRPPIDVYVDLGNGSPLDLFPAYWQAMNLLADRRSSELLNGGAGGARPVKLATIRKLGLGGFILRDVPTNFPPAGATTADTRRVQGNLGLPVLSRFRMIADISHQALYLLPRAGAVDGGFDKDRTGLSTLHEDRDLRVSFVAPGSPADQSGLKVGDRIVSIDGQSIGAGFAQSSLARWRYGPVGRPVRLSLADGRSLTVTLQDLF